MYTVLVFLSIYFLFIEIFFLTKNYILEHLFQFYANFSMVCCSGNNTCIVTFIFVFISPSSIKVDKKIPLPNFLNISANFFEVFQKYFPDLLYNLFRNGKMKYMYLFKMKKKYYCLSRISLTYSFKYIFQKIAEYSVYTEVESKDTPSDS